jgi:lysophospholipase L1-like esterase
MIRSFTRVCVDALMLAVSAAGTAEPRVAPAVGAPALVQLSTRAVGRVALDPAGGFKRQWPGTYFETAFSGREAFFKVGPGDVMIDLFVDGVVVQKLVKPAPGTYAVTGLGPGAHVLRVVVVSENQSGPTSFGGFFGESGTPSAKLPAVTRQIEFIGDSSTVGYGNTSLKRQCSEDEVWLTTDTSQGVAVRTARHFGADYQVNAISGRGIVRNYGGFAADPLPQAYPFVLFDKAQPYSDPAWRPQVIVVGLGANDFSTPLNAGEKWKTRSELQADYESTYLAFLDRLRAANPNAFIIVWTADNSRGEIESEASKVADRWRSTRDRRLAFLAVHDLALTACNWHPSVADDAVISKAIRDIIEAHPEVWSPALPERG